MTNDRARVPFMCSCPAKTGDDSFRDRSRDSARRFVRPEVEAFEAEFAGASAKHAVLLATAPMLARRARDGDRSRDEVIAPLSRGVLRLRDSNGCATARAEIDPAG
jgi:hypothetical protein